jgi:hypothetical protein
VNTVPRPALCPDCRRENRIATVAGPTCPHHPQTGVRFWPAWWNEAGMELRRLQWLKTNQIKKTT